MTSRWLPWLCLAVPFAACTSSPTLAGELDRSAVAPAAAVAPSAATATATAQPTPAAAKPAPFVEVVKANFAAWDEDGDDVLGADEIDRACTDPEVVGEAAAAIASLKRIVRAGTYEVPPLTVEGIAKAATPARPSAGPVAKQADAAAKPSGGDADRADSGEQPVAQNTPKKAPNFTSTYARSLQRIRGTERALFVDPTPDLDACRQGPIGNCWFVATIGAFVHRDPAALRAMITEVDGGYVVTFPGGRSEQVAAITDAELALGGTTGDEGLWLPVLEKAMGQIRIDGNPKKYTAQTASDALAGGSTATVIKLLTGHQTTRIALHKRVRANVTPQPAAENVAPPAELAVKVRAALQEAGKARRLMTCSTNTAKHPPGIVGKHAYAILGYDAERDVVTVWNPHGNTRTVKGEPGLANGYPTKRGVFDVPMLEFVQAFSSVVVETGEPVPPTPPTKSASTGTWSLPAATGGSNPR
ncbi:MAG: hypothetical protein RL398_2440 [Planctomycetota bacterium]|jgi:hypothetical protein